MTKMGKLVSRRHIVQNVKRFFFYFFLFCVTVDFKCLRICLCLLMWIYLCF